MFQKFVTGEKGRPIKISRCVSTGNLCCKTHIIFLTHKFKHISEISINVMREIEGTISVLCNVENLKSQVNFIP